MNEKYVRFAKRARFTLENQALVFLNRNDQRLRRSVLFFTVHKAASSLFSGCILKSDDALLHVDYARRIYRGSTNVEVKINNTGYIYGPLRVSTDRDGVVYKNLIEPIVNKDHLANRTSLVVVRDPRDVLVSSFYSFGYSHNVSSNPRIAEREQREREFIQNCSIDQYVLEKCDETRQAYQDIRDISCWSKRCKIVYYEDLINNWEKFKLDLGELLNISSARWSYIEKQTRPQSTENIHSHRRSGKTHGYLEKLSAKTVDELNERLNDELSFLGYH